MRPAAASRRESRGRRRTRPHNVRRLRPNGDAIEPLRVSDELADGGRLTIDRPLAVMEAEDGGRPGHRAESEATVILTLLLAWVLLGSLVLAWSVATDARNRGASPWLWFVLTLGFNLFGALAYLVLRPTERYEEAAESEAHEPLHALV